MSNAEKLYILIIFLFVLSGVVLSRINIELFENWYVVEDGVIEWLTVLALLFSSIMSFYRASILRPCRRPVFIAALIATGVVCLFGVGEEISWGQRVFDFESTEFFKNFNAQGEVNIHNLVINDNLKINKIVFGLLLGIFIFLYFVILPFLYRKNSTIKRFADNLAVPVPKWEHAVCFIILVVLSELIPVGKKAEIVEFGGCWIFAVMLLHPYNAKIFLPDSAAT